jgi:hypothetical protein
VIAFRCYAMLANGMGGLDWGQLHLAAAMFGARDLDALSERLLVIKLHRPSAPGMDDGSPR